MCNPTAQAYYSTERTDDPQISNDSRLFRHLCIPVQIVTTSNGKKISDQAFKARRADAGTSVDLECLLLNDGLGEVDRRGLMPNSYALAAISVQTARSFSGGVAWTPKPEEPENEGFSALENPYHGEIIKPMTNRHVRDLAANAELLWVAEEMDFGPFAGQSPAIA